MALHLLRAGHQLAVWARRPEAAAPLLAAGAVPAPRGGCRPTFRGGVHHRHRQRRRRARGARRRRSRRRLCGRFDSRGHEHHRSRNGAVAGPAPVPAGRRDARRAGFRRRAGRDRRDAGDHGRRQGGRARTGAAPARMSSARRSCMSATTGPGRWPRRATRWSWSARSRRSPRRCTLAAAAGADPARVRQALAGGSAGSRVLEVMGGRWSTAILLPASRRACITRTTASCSPKPIASACRCRLPPPSASNSMR
jgi:2-hydroxy-3-oxopropionate reductase